MVKQVLAIIVVSLLAACVNPIAHHTPTMTAKWDTTARVDTTAKVDTAVKQLGGK
jgi:hypothetical protein